MFGLKSSTPSPNVQVPTLFFWLETKNKNCNEWTVDKESIACCNLNNSSNQKMSYFSLIIESSKEIRIGIKAVNYQYASYVTFQGFSSNFVIPDSKDMIPSLKIYVE